MEIKTCEYCKRPLDDKGECAWCIRIEGAYTNEGFPSTLVFFRGTSGYDIACIVDIPDAMTTEELDDIIRIEATFGRTRYEYR